MSNGYTTTTTGSPAHPETTTTTGNGYTTTATPPPPECCVMVNTINGKFEIDVLHEMGSDQPPVPVIGNVPVLGDIAEEGREAMKDRKWKLKGTITVQAEKVCIPCEEELAHPHTVTCVMKDAEGNDMSFGPAEGCVDSEFPPYKIKCENFTWPPSRQKRSPGFPHNENTNPYIPPGEGEVDYGFAFDCDKATNEPTTQHGALNQAHRSPRKPTLCIHQVEVIKCEGPAVGACAEPPCKCGSESGIIDTSPKVFNPATNEWELEDIEINIGFSGRGPTLVAVGGAFGAGPITAELTQQGCADKFLAEFERGLKGKMGSRVDCECNIGDPRSPRNNNQKRRDLLPFLGNIFGPDVEDRIEDVIEVLDELGWDPYASGPNSNGNTSDDEPCGC